MRFSRFVLVVFLLAAGAIIAPSARLASSSDPLVFLRDSGDFSEGDLDLIARGEPVARLLDTERRQVAVIGAVRINAPVERILAHYRDVSLLGESSAILQVATFSSPPRVEDLQPWVMEKYDLETIRECTPGDCGVRLSAAEMARFEREVMWEAPDWRSRAGTAWRRMLIDYVAGYLARGDVALSEYRNKEEPLRVAEELDLLFRQSEFFREAAPGFMRFVEDYPRGRPAGTDDLLYWMKDDFGIRPVFSITHLLLHTSPGDSRGSSPLAMIATKQIYATHYFDAGLGLTAVYRHPSGGSLLISQNRVRTRSLVSLMRTFVRSKVRSSSRSAMEKVLRSMKTRLERQGISRK